MKLYIAGPMRGYPLFNYPAFFSAAEELRSKGHIVHNPAQWDVEHLGFNPATDTPRPLHEYMAIDLPVICKSEGVVLLEGWMASQGAKIEASVAWALHIPLYNRNMEKLVLSNCPYCFPGVQEPLGVQEGG